jgi:hypothetical protein
VVIGVVKMDMEIEILLVEDNANDEELAMIALKTQYKK